MIIAAVITADIVNSTRLGRMESQQLTRRLRSVLAPYKFEFYRGDSFQVYISEPEKALDILLRLRTMARIINADCDIRASIGIGRIKSRFRKLSTAAGEAFMLSGRAFDELSKTESRLVMQSYRLPLTSSLKIMAYFIDYLFKYLTPKQSEVLSVLLAGHTQQEAAKKLKKSQSTINKHAQTAGWNELAELSKEFRELIRLNT